MKIKIRPSLKQKLTFSATYSEVLDIIKLSNKDIRQELLHLLKPNNWVYFGNEKALDFLHHSAEEGIRNDLYYQLHTTNKHYDVQICNYIIDSLDEHGFFNYHKELPFPFPEKKVQEALTLIQSFEPEGIALENSLAFIHLQLRKKKAEIALRLLDECEEMMIHQQLDKIQHYLHITPSQLQLALQTIRSCQIYPCTMEVTSTQWIRPDVLLEIENNQFIIKPTIFELPTFSIDQKSLSAASIKYLRKTNLTLDMINQRNFTIIQIFRALCEIQSDFFISKAALKPCRLEDVSRLCGVHISTISRCAHNKYYEFEGQLQPLSHLLAAGNIQGKSHTELHQIVDQLLALEKPNEPYNDEQLLLLLKDKNIVLSRRGLANLRNKWGIPNSYQRKKLNKKI